MNKRTVVSGSIVGVGVIIAALFFLSHNSDSAERSGKSDKTQASASAMDPDMSGMAHGETVTEEDHSEVQITPRPLKATLSVFGFGTFLVLFGAGVLRRKDRRLAAAKKAARVGINAKK